MTEDKEMEELFSLAKTSFEDNPEFMAKLSEKLDRIEYLRQIQESRRKSYVVGLIVAFAFGLLFGCIGLTIAVNMPAGTPFVADGIISRFAVSVFHGMNGLIATVLSLVVTAGTVCIALNVQDISRMKHSVF